MQKLPCILLVDDDPTTNYINRRLLEKLDIAHKLLVAQDGVEALNLLNEHCPQLAGKCPVLVLLDMKMPVMDGFSFLEAYQQLPAAQQQNILVVMLSTSLHPQDVHRAQELPVAAFLSKPLTNEKVRHLLALHFPQDQPTS